MALSWRKQIDNAICSKMEAQGFKLVDFFVYMKDLSPDVDMVVQLKQGSRYSAVAFTDIYINMGVMHKELAELEAVLNMPQEPTSPPPHWWHTVEQSWLIHRNLNSLIPEWSLRLTRHCREDEIEKVTDAVVEIVVDIGLPLARRFDNTHSIIQELESPSDPQMRGQCIYFKLPLAYMLAGQLDKAQQSLMDFERKLREEDPPKHKYFKTFEKNLSVELARRKADLS
ncbi:MAG: hypothetical protein WCT03_24220 [Candidatus Obscuribacterales bacterium]